MRSDHPLRPRENERLEVEGSPVDQSNLIWRGPLVQRSLRLLGIMLTLICAGFAALVVDAPLSRWAFSGKRLAWLHGFLGSMEPFGQPTAILMTAGAILLCSWRLRPGVPRLVAASLGAGLMADLCKLLVSRVRPRAFDWSGTALATFHEFLPGLGKGSSHQSFPSSHTATAMGFGLALATMFPEGRWLFMTATTLVALQRVEAGAHYLSDTCWGAAVGYGVAFVMFHPRLLGRWFSEREACRWKRAEERPALTVVSASPSDETKRQAS